MALYAPDIIACDDSSAILRISLACSHPQLLRARPASLAPAAPAPKAAKPSKAAKAKPAAKAKAPERQAQETKAEVAPAEPRVAAYFTNLTPARYERHALREESSLDCLPRPEAVAGADTFYLTTAINYTNGYPHMGHAYEAITSDIIARYHRRCGRDVFFLTGSDEHGQKIAKTAEREGVPPQTICDRYALAFQALNQRLLVQNDGYVRTTAEAHMATCRKLWALCAARTNAAGESDIYLNAYEGWYNEREETFVSDTDAQLADFLDAASGLPLTKMSEESYFFRMSRYQERLVAHIAEHPGFIQPDDKRIEILERLKEPLRDLCVSRTTFDWGITLPPGHREKHVMYVWFDALTNYLSGVEEAGKDLGTNRYWPADLHVIGKDIIWFHAVIWPCMLMSAELPLPRAIFSHGFVSGADGRKMSKSLGNVVDPHDLLDFVSADTFRWYMASEAAFGRDLNFSTGALITKHNADLIKSLGNLVHRATSLCVANCEGQIPAETYGAAADLVLPFGLELVAEAERLMATFDISGLADMAIGALRSLNGWITVQEPWKLKEDPSRRSAIIRAVVEGVWFLAHFLEPFMPAGVMRIFAKIQAKPRALGSFGEGPLENVLEPGTPVAAGEVLYTELRNCVENPPEEGEAKGEGKAGAKGGKAPKKKAAAAPSQEPVTMLELRVGQITKVDAVEGSDHLFVEEIDCGEAEPRTIASGLRDFYQAEDLLQRKVVVFCNLKPRKMGTVRSQGMVLCAEKEVDGQRRVEFVEVPADAEVGQRLAFGVLEGEPQSANYVGKKKVLEGVLPDLRADAEGQCHWKGHGMTAGGSPCVAPTLRDCELH